jgi:hypothetical protein
MAYQQKPNSGTAFKNKFKSTANHPDYRGTWVTESGEELQLAIWVKQGKKEKFFSLSASPKQADPGAYVPPKEHSSPDDLPF